MSPPRIVIHLGQHKTGSKYLQAFLAANRTRLLEYGIDYPEDAPDAAHSAHRNSHYGLYSMLQGDSARELVSAHFARWQQTLRSNGAHTLLLSCEDLFDMQTAHELPWTLQRVESAAQLLSAQICALGWHPVLVVYLRRPDALLHAHYAQYIKGRATNDLAFDAFYQAFHERLDGPAILAAWRRSFPEASIVVRAYEEPPGTRDIVLDFFEHALGFSPDASWQPVAHELETMNITPDYRHIELIRRINSGHWTSRLTTRKEVLEHAFRQRARKGPDTFVPPALKRLLVEQHAAGLNLIARENGGREHFFDPPWQAEASAQQSGTAHLGFADQLLILAQLFVARLRRHAGKRQASRGHTAFPD